MVMGFTDPGGARPTPNRPTREYKSYRPQAVGFQDPGLTAGQLGFTPNRNRDSGPKNQPVRSNFAPSVSSNQRKNYYDRLGGGVLPLNQIRAVQDKYNRVADIPLFQQRTKDYAQFMDATKGTGNISGAVPVVGGQNMLSMSKPVLTARAPTFAEAGQDFLRGVGQFGQAIAEKGTPMMAFAKDLIGGITNFFTPNQGPVPTDQFASFKEGLTNPQLAIFNYHINSGNTPNYARQMALMGRPMANGGIATLN